MLDIQFIRENADLVQKKSEQKGYKVDIAALLKADTQRRELQARVEELRAERNQLSGGAKGKKPGDQQIKEGKRLKQEISELEDKLQKASNTYQAMLLDVPNMPVEGVPVGQSEEENVILKTVGEKPGFKGFKPKSHYELGQANDWIDKERAAKVAGSRFTYLKGEVVRLQFALIQFVFATLADEKLIKRLIKENDLKLTPKAFVPVLPPALVNTEAYEASARLDAEEMTYKLADDDLWLNASAEHSLCNMYLDEILPEDRLPLRYVGYSTSFRREAGSYGKDLDGIIRMHQFDKLEMEVFSTPETGLDEHKLLVALQEYMVQKLGLSYQLLEKCTADIGKPNAKGVDINIWLPGQGNYRETHTADYMTDYQARRLKTKLRRSGGSTEFVHTNDATAFALGRTLVAIIENYQTKDGRISIPEALKPYVH